MSDYTTTKARIFQWVGIVLILAVFAGAYWYFQVYGSTLNAPQNDLNTNGLVGLWSFNGDDISGTTAYDRGTGGNNGTLTNAPQVTQGIVGQALNFFPNGSDTDAYVTIGDPGDGDLDFGSGDFSVGFWMKSNGYSSQGSSVNAAVAKHNLDAGNTAAGYSFYYASTNLMNFVIGNGTTAYTTTQTVSTTADNQWHQYTGVRSGSTMYLYIDGILVTSTTVSGSVSNGTGFCIGDTCGGIRNVNGSIDEVRVYNRAIAASEVASLYAQGGGTKSNTSVSQPQGTGRLDSGLAGYWKLDDGSGTSAIDSSTNGNTGTLTNGPTWTTGQVGGAVDFDGSNDYINTTDLSSIEGTSQVTFSAWVNADTLSTRRGVIGKEGQNYAMETEWTTGDDVLLYFGGGSIYGYTTSDILATGQWQLWTMVFDGNQTGNASRLKFYLNGVERALTFVGTIGSTSPSGSANAVRIGDSYDNSGNGFLDGKIDEVRIYNRALSADEVGQLYRLTAPTGVDTGLKGYWSFNAPDMASTTAYDRSGAGNTGTLTNSPTITEGKSGQALSFDGSNDYVSVAHDSALNAYPLTVSAWFKTSTTGGARGIVNKFLSSSNNGWNIFFDNSDNLCAWYFKDASNYVYAGGGCTLNVTGLKDGQWHFVTFVVDSSGGTLYVDGVSRATRSWTGTAGAVSTSQEMRIGHYPSSSDYFNGKIDEVRIYNRALTAAEIKGLYDTGESDKVNSSISQPQGAGRLDSDLVAYWPFDDGTGSTAVDVSTNSFDGSASGGPTWTTGQIGGAAYFDGSARFTNSSSTAVALNPIDGESFTLAGWFNRDTFTGDDTLLAKRAGQSVANEGYIVYIDGTTDKVTFEVSDDVDEYQLESVSTFTATGWHHVVVSWNDVSGAALYINGVAEAATVTGTFTNINDLTSATGLALGADSIAANLFNGSLDEIRIYGRALSGDEVAQLYRLTSPTGTETSLKGYWSFNGQDVSGTTAYDRSGAGNTGTLTNSPTITEGKLGQGLSFDGTDDYVTMGTSTALDMTSPLTISAWIKPAAVNGIYRIFTHGRNSCCGTEVSLTLRAPGNIMFEINNDSLVAGSVLSPGNWYHIVGTYDQTTAILYVNGTLNNSASYSSAISEYNNYSAIGTALNSGSPENYFNGIIDEVRMYNRALSASEIQSLYNASR